MYFTYRDAIDHLIDVFNLDGKDENDVSRKLRRAVKEACSKLTGLHEWECFRDTGMFITTAPYETGTVAYNATTRELTLTGGTWPSDAAYGDVIISNARYRVARRVSDSVVTLDEYQSPGVTVASGTTYKWVKPRYIMPEFVGDIREITDIQLLSLIRRIQSDDNFWYSEAWNITGAPTAWSMIESKARPGQWEVWLSSVPNDVRKFRYLYQLRWYGTEVDELRTGTVSVSGDVATFSTGVLTSAHVGTVLRVSSSASYPTSDIGRYDKTTKAVIYNPHASEHIITQVNSSTEAILNQPVSSSVSSKGYTISSHLRLYTEMMRELFHRLCEYQYQVLSRADSKIVAIADSMWRDAMRNAMAADARNLDSQRAKIVDPRPIIRET